VLNMYMNQINLYSMGWIAFIILGSMLVITIAHIIGDFDIPIDKEDISLKDECNDKEN